MSAATTTSDRMRRDMERHLLMAVDESANARRAVLYLADFFGSSPDVYVTVLTIIPEPSEDFFATEEERKAWLADKRRQVETAHADYLRMLVGAGFEPSRVTSRIIERPCVSIAEAILEEQEKLRCCIVVVGRRGLTHNEEFVFGSTSSKILREAKNCAVMVVE